MENWENIDEYIASFPLVVQEQLQQVRGLVHSLVPFVKESIKYGIPTFSLQEHLLHFAAYKTHVGLYPGPDAVAFFRSRLDKNQTSKGTIKFPIDKPLPLDLIKEMVEYRVLAIQEKYKTP